MFKSIMTVEEIAKYLGFSVKKIYRLVETNTIPASKIGRQYRFIKDAVDRWLEKKNILIQPDWNQRLDLVLKRMRAKASKAQISSAVIEKEIKKVRSERRENT